ncbi:MAG TPA: hypothetical protein VLE89_06770 [Chlamydiales bacterium]|nr:hypothetical protein [Chlamydiales bacterium]
MEETIEARVSPEEVWEVWEKAHALEGAGNGWQSKNKFRYKILDVKKGESFSILWKTLFVRLLFTHLVKPTKRGSEIQYQVQIKGLFAWPVQWMLGPKIKRNIGYVLKAIVKELETKRIEKPDNR